MIKKIPITIKTSLIDIAMSIDELNKKQGAKPYIMVVDRETDMTIMGCVCASDIIFYADYFSKFDKPINPEDMTVICALIADPADLPFCLPGIASVFVLHDEFGICEFKFMYEATEYIEMITASSETTVIEDFAVLIGIKLSDIFKSRLITKIEEKRLERTENCATKESNSDT